MQATWKGRECEIVEVRGDRYRLRYYSGTRNGEPRARYGWANAGDADFGLLPSSPAAEAVSVGRRGQWSQRQDVTEAAAAAVAKADGGVRAGWEPYNDDYLRGYTVYRHMESGCIAWCSDNQWVASQPRVNTIARQIKVSAYIDVAMDAAEAWWAANKPKESAPAPARVPCPHCRGIAGLAGCALGVGEGVCPPGADCEDGAHCTIPAPADPDALPVGWEPFTDSYYPSRAAFRHAASGAFVLHMSYGPWLSLQKRAKNGNSEYASEYGRDYPTRSAAIAACEAWLKAQEPTRNITVNGKPAPKSWDDAHVCPNCAVKDAEIARLTQQQSESQRAYNDANKRAIDAETECARVTAELTDARTRADTAAESLRLTCDELVRVKRERDSAERAAMEAVNEMRRCNNTSERALNERDRYNNRANRWRNAFYMVGAAWLFAIGILISMVARAAGVQ